MNGSVVEENSNDVAEAETAATQAFQTAITHADDIAKSLFKDCVNHAEDSTFAHMNLLKKGAAEMEIHLGKYLKAKSKKPRGKAENAFNSGLQRLAGGKYMAQHSGFEHTTENGIDTLQHFDKVADAVEKVYPASHLIHEKIKKAFAGYPKVANLMYPFLTYMKSQKKRHLERFLQLLDPLLLAWDETFPDKKYFLKLHHIMAHLPGFVDKYQMLGRILEESFESVHSLMA